MYNHSMKYTKTAEEMETITIERSTQHLSNVFKVIRGVKLDGDDDVGPHRLPTYFEASGSAGLITVANEIYRDMYREVLNEFGIHEGFANGGLSGLAGLGGPLIAGGRRLREETPELIAAIEALVYEDEDPSA